MSEEQIIKDHRLTISASKAHRLMSYYKGDILPKGAVALIDSMAKVSNSDNEGSFKSPAMSWGIENERHAIERVAQELGVNVDDCNDDQKRLYAGTEYYDFVSALPDGIVFLDGQVITVEVKCLDTKNHDYIVSEIGDSSEELKRKFFKKWVQVQVQSLCAENEFQQSVTSIICFFDPRSEVTDFHYVIVEPCQEFREQFKRRVVLAKNLYDSIKNESISAPVIFGAELPKTKLVKKSDDFEISSELLQSGLDDIVSKTAEHFGVTIKDGHFVGGEVFNCETQEGRELAKKAKNKVTKIRTSVLKLNQPVTKELFAKYKKSLSIDQGITEKLNDLRDHLIAPLTEWEKEQERIQQDIIDAENDKKRIAEETAGKVRQAILEKMEILKVYPCDFESLESIASKYTVLDSINIDAMFGEFEDDARQLKENSFNFLNGCEEGIIQRQKELEEERKHNEGINRLEELNRINREKETKRLNDWDAAIVANELFDLKNKKEKNRLTDLDEADIIFNIYSAMNPVLHQRVIDTAKAVTEFLDSTKQASLLQNLFGSTKQEIELKKAFIEIIKGIKK